MNCWPECKTRVSVFISSFGFMAKMSQFAPIIFLTFYQISGSLPYTVQHIKNLEGRFLVSARYGPFWLFTWSKMKNFDFFHKKKTFIFFKHLLWKKSKSYIFDHVKSQIGPYLAKRQNSLPKFFICCAEHSKLQENW